MVLVDTSVWIRAFRGSEPWASELDRLLDRGEVAGHELVYGELLIGDKGARRSFLSTYEKISQVASIQHREVIGLVLHRELYGRGLGWIDVHLLASTLAARMKLWTADSALMEVAAELGVGYRGGAGVKP